MSFSSLAAPPAGLLDTFNGLPTHPLVVHAALGLVVLAALGGVLSAVPRWRGWMLPATAVVGVLAALSTLVATETGEGLEHRLPHSDLIEQHAESGERTRTVALLLAVLLVAWWAVDRMLRRAAAPGGTPAGGAGGGGASGRDTDTLARTAPPALRIGSLVLAVVTVVVSLASAYFLYVTGDQGARAVWSGTAAASSDSGNG